MINFFNIFIINRILYLLCGILNLKNYNLEKMKKYKLITIVIFIKWIISLIFFSDIIIGFKFGYYSFYFLAEISNLIFSYIIVIDEYVRNKSIKITNKIIKKFEKK